MKKYLFSAVSVFALFAYQAKAQTSATLNVMKNTNVKVMSGALLYVKGDVAVKDYDDDTKRFSNEGKVKIQEGVLTNGRLTYLGQNNAGRVSNFVNEAKANSYGQLIIIDDKDRIDNKLNSGVISSGVRFNPSFKYHPIALPYSNVSPYYIVGEAFFGSNIGVKSAEIAKGFKSFTAGKAGFDKNRYKNVLFYFDNGVNGNTPVFDHVDNSFENITPYRYYAFNSEWSSLGTLPTSDFSTLTGTPFSAETIAKVQSYTVGKSTDVNKYGETYGSYIFDYTIDMPARWDESWKKDAPEVDASGFGDNIYSFGNPYTSNINLWGDKDNTSFKDEVTTIVQFSAQDYTEAINKGQASGSYGKTIMIAATKDLTGNEKALVVPPFQTFSVKTNHSGSKTFKFSDGMKTFEMPTGGLSQNTLYLKGNKALPVVNQVGLDLYDGNGFTGVETYVVASDIYEASEKGRGIELYNTEIGDKDTSIYTLQENEVGGVDDNLAKSKAYINGVNSDKYIGKPIHLVVQNGKGEYTLKARLNETLKNNKNTFYFEDKKSGKVVKIDENFHYTFNVDGTEKDRFVLYWAATPKSEKVEEVAKQEVNTTVVFRDADTYKVRFDRGIKKADVFVYNISGQLVNTAKNVDASEDYIVPLRGNSAVYIIKVVGDNGQVVTKKIIK